MFTLLLAFFPALADCPQDDSYEDNDTYADAVSLNGSSASNLFVCDTDEDWFLIEGTAGELLTIEAFFVHADGDIDLKLYSAEDSTDPLATAVGVSDNETLSHMAESDGVYYLQVVYFSVLNTGTNTYSLEISSGAAPDCPSDAYEENNSMSAAVPLGSVTSNLNVCEFDADWYSISLAEAEQLKVEYEFNSEDGYISSTLYNADGESLETASYISDGVYELEYLSLSPQDLFLNVEQSSDGDDSYGVSYSMNISTVQFEPCSEDSYSDNTTAETAIDLEPGTYSMVACSNEFFRFRAPADSGVQVRASFDTADGDLDLTLYGQSEDGLQALDSSTSYDSLEEVEYNVEEEQGLLIEVELFSDEGDLGMEYELTIDVGSPLVIEPSGEPSAEPDEEPSDEPSEDETEDEDSAEDSGGAVANETDTSKTVGGCSSFGLVQGGMSFWLVSILLLWRRRKDISKN